MIICRGFRFKMLILRFSSEKTCFEKCMFFRSFLKFAKGRGQRNDGVQVLRIQMFCPVLKKCMCF